MASLPPGSFVDRPASAGLEEIGTIQNQEKMSASPLIFPNNIGSPGGFNNHFMMIDILQESASVGESFDKLVNKQINGGGAYKRQLMQAEQTIVLYMPSTMTFTTQNQYEDVSLTSLVLNNLPGVMGTAGKFAADTARLLDHPVNPRTEVLFTNTAVRTFQFDFLFAPSSEQESNTLKKIVLEMRKAAAVRRMTVGGIRGLLWIPPRKLQIRFFKIIDGRAEENDAFSKLKPLVIENLDFDFAPTGTFSTFTNGYPVATRMMLRVKEDEVIDRDWIIQNDTKTTLGTERF